MAKRRQKLLELEQATVKIISDTAKETPYRKFKPYAESVLESHAAKLRLQKSETIKS